MSRDVKEVIGALMRVLDGGEIAVAEVEDLGFEGEGEVQEALNEAFVALMEFAHQSAARRDDPALDRAMRASLQACLDKIIAVCEAR